MLFSFNSFSILAAPPAAVPAGRFAEPDWAGWGNGLLLSVGVACAALLIVRFARAGRYHVPAKPWGVEELKILATVLVGLLIVSNSTYAVIALLRNIEVTDLARASIPAELSLRVAVLLGLGVFLQRRRLSLAGSFGLDSLPPARAAAWGLVFALASLPPVALLVAGSEKLCRLFGFQATDQPIAALFITSHSPVLLFLLVFFSIVVAPLFEEVVFRGFAYPVAKQYWGAGRALFAVSAIFALSHLHGPSLVPLFAFALGLGLAYELTGSLLTSITMHAMFNTIMVVKLFLARGAT